MYGEVPPYSVVVPGSLPGKPNPDGSPCAVALLLRDRRRPSDAQTRAKTAINELLRT